MSLSLRRQVIGRGSVYTLGTVAPILVTLVITPLVFRVLGDVQYGYVGIAITTYQAAAVILPLGLPAAITRHALIEQSGRRGAIGLLFFGSAVTIAAGAVMAVTAPGWGRLVFGEVGWWLALPVASAAGLSWVALSQALLRAEDRVVAFVAIGWLMAILPPAVSLGVTILVPGGATQYLALLAGGHVCVGAVAIAAASRGVRARVDVTEIRSSLRVALPTVPHQLAMASVAVAAVAIATSVGGVPAGGRTQLALLLGTAPLVIIGALNNAWAPHIYRASAQQRPLVLNRSTALVALVALAVVTAFVVAAPAIATLIVGPSSGAVLAGALIAAAATGLMVLYLANIHMVFVSGRTGWLAVATPIALILAVVTAAILASRSKESALAALVVPVFYAIQSVSSGIMRRSLTDVRLNARAFAAAVCGGVAVPIIMLLFRMAGLDVAGAVAVVLVAVATGGATLYVERARDRRAGR